MGSWKYTINHNKVNQLNPKFWYILGLYCADGWCFSKGYTLAIGLTKGGGKELLENIREYLEYTKPVQAI